MSRRCSNLTGKRFGRLVAIKDTGQKKNGSHIWECNCDCGNTKTQSVTLLNSGRTKSCGCLLKDVSGKMLPKGEASFNSLYSDYKRSSNIRGVEFNLTKDKFKEITSQNCHYCGNKPEQIAKSSKSANGAYVYNGIDRTDNSKGYVKENCKPCCWQCNKMKRSLSEKSFLNHADKISKHRRSDG